MYHIQLMLTRECNKSCYYCTTHSNDYGVEVDIGFLRYVLNLCPEETAVELTGGEIGLIDNLDDVYRIVKDNPRVKHIRALSNGMLRMLNVDWIKDVEYWEHLIYDIMQKDIKKFYDLDLEQDHKYVIVTTQITTHSLLSNWKYFEDMGLFRPNFFYKLMNHKSNSSINNYFGDLCTLYRRLNDVYCQRMLIHYYAERRFNHSPYADKKELCSKWSPNIYVDLQKRKIGHCAMNLEKTVEVSFNEKNLLDMSRGLYKDPCCEDCYSFDNGKGRSLLNNRSYIQ
jgi:hypothetical protein